MQLDAASVRSSQAGTCAPPAPTQQLDCASEAPHANIRGSVASHRKAERSSLAMCLEHTTATGLTQCASPASRSTCNAPPRDPLLKMKEVSGKPPKCGRAPHLASLTELRTMLRAAPPAHQSGVSATWKSAAAELRLEPSSMAPSAICELCSRREPQSRELRQFRAR